MKKLILVLLTTAAATAAIGFSGCSNGQTGGNGASLSRSAQNQTLSGETNAADEKQDMPERENQGGFEFIPQVAPPMPHMLPPHGDMFERIHEDMRQQIMEHSHGNMPELTTKEGAASDNENGEGNEQDEQVEQPEQPIKKPRRKNRRTKEKHCQSAAQNAAENLQSAFDGEYNVPAHPLPAAIGAPERHSKRHGKIKDNEEKTPDNGGNNEKHN